MDDTPYDFEEQDDVYKIFKCTDRSIAIAICAEVSDAQRIVDALNNESSINNLFHIR